jgi:L-amino acid N-acyltransferase YncA
VIERVKHRYVAALDVEGRPATADQSPVELRPATRGDTEALAQLMLDAYIGTIDYEGESLEEARAEVAAFFDHDPLLEHSWIAFAGDTAASGVLVSMWRGEPLIGYVLTRADHKRRGLGRTVLEAALHSLGEAGWAGINAFITEGNTASEALFRGVGAVRAEES